jgi:hypothetical protein
MRKDIWFYMAPPAILGSFGLFARWLQVLNVFDTETGLARPGAFLSWLVALLCLAAVFVLLFSVLRLRRYRAPVEPVAAFHGGRLFRLLMSASALLTAVGVALFFLHGDILTRILALLGLAAAGGLLFYPSAPKWGDLGCLIATMPILFFSFWLIVFYKENAADPVLWDYAPEVLAIATSALAFYYLAGYLYYRAKPFRAIYFDLLAAFFCVVVLADRHSTGNFLVFGGAALAFFTLGWVLLQNLASGD